jgi:two-component system chemotaxis response regulator CheB
MDAFAKDLTPEDGNQHTGMVCPDCHGSLTVGAEEPSSRLIFRCRVGHVYSAEDVLIGKEDALEAALWTALHALEELAAFLVDIDDGIPSLDADERTRRISSLQAHARALRDLIGKDVSIKLGPAADQ